MKKRIINTIMVAENFFEAAAFGLRRGKLQQRTFAGAFLDTNEKKDASQIIKTACRIKNKVGVAEDFLVVIPRSQATVKNFELPSANAVEIGHMVDFQLQDSLPYRPEDLIVQNLIYPSHKEGYSQVRTVIVQKELIENLIEILKLSNIRISAIDLSSNVLLNRFSMLYKKEPFFAKTNLLINIEGENADFVFMKDGRILLSRGVLLNKEGFEDAFMEAVEKSLFLFNHKFSDEIRLVFLWGRRSDLGALAQSLSGRFALETKTREDENLLKSLAYTCGEEKQRINLLPRVIKEKRERFLKRRNLVQIAVFGVVIVVFSILAFFFDFKEKEKQLDVLNVEIGKIESDAVELQRKKVIIEDALIKQKQTLQSLDVLAEFYSITQQGIFFNSFLLMPAKSVIIKGQAEKLDKVLEFIGSLESSPLFENVELKYTSKRRLKDKEIIDFEIALFISSSSVSQ